MTKNETAAVITWDWKEQPRWGAIQAALKQFEPARIVEIDTNSDEFSIVICHASWTDQKANEFYNHRYDENETGEI